MEMPCRTRALYQVSMESFSFIKRIAPVVLCIIQTIQWKILCRDDNFCSEDNNDNTSFDTETRKHYYRGHLRTESDAYSEQVVLLVGKEYGTRDSSSARVEKNHFGLPSSRSKRLKGDHQNSLKVERLLHQVRRDQTL